MSRFKTAFIDVDSTLCGIEGIDWLASQRSESFRKQVASLTEQAMEGETALESVYARRLGLVAPTRDEVGALSREYARRFTPGAVEALSRMKETGIDVHLISGGLLPAIQEVARESGLDVSKAHAVGINFDAEGHYSSFDATSPLATQFGKRAVIEALDFVRPAFIVGDGMTDAEARPAVDAFVAFTGYIRRDPAVARADFVVSNFEELMTWLSE